MQPGWPENLLTLVDLHAPMDTHLREVQAVAVAFSAAGKLNAAAIQRDIKLRSKQGTQHQKLGSERRKNRKL